MQVRVTLGRPEDREDERLLALFINVSLDIVDEILYRTPDYVIRGKHKQTITFYGLSKREADTIDGLYRREIVEDGLVTRVIKINSVMEEDTGPYLFIRPEYAEGVKEDLEEMPGYVQKIDIRSFVGSVVRTTYRVFFEDTLKEGGEAPITTMAIAMGYTMGIFEPDGTDEEELRDWIDYEIANEPMPSTRVPRRRRPRARRS